MDTKVADPVQTVHGDKGAWIVPLISGAFDLATQFINYGKSKRENEENIDYNSPVNQVKRMKQAGLNPSMVYGQISSGQSNFQSAPFSNPAHRVVNTLSQMQSFKNQILQNDLLQTQITSQKLDNQYKEGSMYNRLLRAMYSANLAGLQVRYQRGEITRQQYNNEVARLNKDLQVWYHTNHPDFFVSYGDDSANAEERVFSPMSPAMYNLYMQTKRSGGTTEKVYQDYWNAIKSGNLLDAHIVGAKLQNEINEVARDYTKLHNRPFSNVTLVDGIISGIIDRIAKKYGVDDPIQFLLDKILD